LFSSSLFTRSSLNCFAFLVSFLLLTPWLSRSFRTPVDHRFFLFPLFIFIFSLDSSLRSTLQQSDCAPLLSSVCPRSRITSCPSPQHYQLGALPQPQPQPLKSTRAPESATLQTSQQHSLNHHPHHHHHHHLLPPPSVNLILLSLIQSLNHHLTSGLILPHPHHPQYLPPITNPHLPLPPAVKNLQQHPLADSNYLRAMTLNCTVYVDRRVPVKRYSST